MFMYMFWVAVSSAFLFLQIHVRDSLQSPTEGPNIRANKKLGPLTLPRPKIILPFSQTFTMKIQEGYGSAKKVVGRNNKEDYLR